MNARHLAEGETKNLLASAQDAAHYDVLRVCIKWREKEERGGTIKWTGPTEHALREAISRETDRKFACAVRHMRSWAFRRPVFL